MAASFISRALIQFHGRPILIPWVHKSIAISCSRGRDFSAFPVRHIPKKSIEGQESEAASPMKNFVDIEKHGYLDRNVQETGFSDDGRSKYGDTSFGSTRHDQLIISVDDKVEWGKEEEVNAEFVLEHTDNARQDAERMAIRLLASRANTALELKKKLLGKRFALNVVNAVITDFRTRGLLNDSLYAELYSRSRWSSSSWGPRRIKQALLKKGVSEVDADKAIKLVFKNDEAGGEQESEESEESGLAMSKPSVDQLLVQASKQWLKGQGVPIETRKSRIVRWLQYRGFNWSVVSFILKKLESNHPP